MDGRERDANKDERIKRRKRETGIKRRRRKMRPSRVVIKRYMEEKHENEE